MLNACASTGSLDLLAGHRTAFLFSVWPAQFICALLSPLLITDLPLLNTH